jgi:cobalt-zinc-cadmium efflux system membrane fusion protein
MFIRAELTTVQHNARIVVPRSAIQIINQENVIFVETDEGLIPRIVRLGISDSNSFEIIDGLHIGERFVVAGGLALKSELNKAALEHAGHAH